jgi:hypothetical protein
MSESSTSGAGDDRAGATGVAGGRRTAVPSPPRPPAPLHDDAMPYADSRDGGPATSAMPGLGSDDELDVASRGRDEPFRVGPITGRGPVTGYTSTVPPLTPLVPGADRRVAERRPQVAVRGPRRARLVVRRVDPWSVLKFSFLFSICLLIVWVVAASALLSLLRSMHVFDNINSVLASATSSDTTQKGFQINPSAHDVRLWAAIIGAVNALLFTALATLGAFLYNLISILVGGVEVTLGERD